MEIFLSPKVAEKKYCSLCDYKCSKNSDYEKHLITRKHAKRVNGNNLEIKEISKISTLFLCIKCDRHYKTNSGLWKHKQQCKYIQQNIEQKIILEKSQIPISSNVIIELVKQNQEFKELIIEQNKQIMELTTKVINTNTNITNKIVIIKPNLI